MHQTATGLLQRACSHVHHVHPHAPPAYHTKPLDPHEAMVVAECTWQAQGAVLRVLGIYWRLSRLWLTAFGQKGMFYQVCGRFFFQKLQGHPHIDGQLLMGAEWCNKVYLRDTY